MNPRTPDETRYELLAASDQAKVDVLHRYLLHAIDAWNADPGHEPTTFVDMMMAVHNFHRAIIGDIYERDPRATLIFRAAADTFALGMETDAAKRGLPW